MPKDGQLTLFHGVIRDVDTGKGIPDAVFDMWQASTNGKYDVFDPANQTRHNLRGKFRTNEEGKFWFYCIKPTEYAIDTSGPSAELLRMMGRHPYRPAHIHMMVTHPDYVGVTAQLYPNDDPYLETDTACAVKDDLLLDFKPVKDDPKGAVLDVEYNVRLISKKYKPESAMFMQNANQNKFWWGSNHENGAREGIGLGLMTDSGGKLNFDITGIRCRDRYENYDVIFKEFPRRRIDKKQKLVSRMKLEIKNQ